MKVRHPLLIRGLGWAGAWVIRGWVGSLRYDFCQLGPDVRPLAPGAGPHYIYAFWHENLLPAAYWWRRCGAHVLISEHADGRLIAEVSRRLGYGVVAGSSTRGGVRAIKQMVQLSRQTHLAITPDGPRGPRRCLQPGLVYLASKTGLGVVPLGIGLERPWRLASWDRFALPRPGTRGRAVIGAPIRVPLGVGSDRLEHYRARIEEALLHASDLAERWAATGRLPQPDAGPQVLPFVRGRAA
jgi:lysophospholipid acyltransferase (LPLAT)-like uncharacterized protein